MRAFLDRLSQTLTSQMLSVSIAAIFGYYSGIYGLKDEIYALKKENSELRDLLRIEIAEVNNIISELKINIVKNEQYINGIADPSINKLQGLEKKLYALEKDIAVINVRDKSSPRKK